MFPLHQSNELCFQISPNPDHKSEDLEDHNNVSIIQIQRPRRNLLTSLDTDTKNYTNNNNSQSSEDNKNNNNNKNKKMKHRDIERQRRQDMASLHALLRQHLPLHLIKGKRSISDHIHEASRYIKHLQMNIRDLGEKRDELKVVDNFTGLSNTTVVSAEPAESSEICSPARGKLTVHRCCGGVEIGIAVPGDCKEGNIGNLPLSRVLEVILEEGLSIVSCVSTKVNGRFLYNIHSEIGTNSVCDESALEQKLNNVIFHRRDT